MGTVINSFNIFCDSRDAYSVNSSEGTDYNLLLNEGHIHSKDGQHIRLSLTNFNMTRNWTNIHASNNLLRMNGTQDIVIPVAEYETISKLEKAFIDAFIASVAANDTSVTFTAAGNVTQTTYNTKNYKQSHISFTVTDSASNLEALKLVTLDGSGDIETIHNVHGFAEESDSYIIFGGDRTEGSVTISSNKPNIPVTKAGGIFNITSTTVTLNSGSEVVNLLYESKYPIVQLLTEPYLYLRTDLGSYALESGHLKNVKTQIEHSDILGKIPVSNGYYTLDTSLDNNYSIRLQQNNLQSMRLRVTNHKNELVSTFIKKKQQSQSGNLNFSCVIKVEIIQEALQHHLQSNPYQPNIPDRKLGNPLKYVDEFFIQNKK